MAQLNSRGTLTRSRWDYFEHSNGWASVYGSVTSGGIGAYFTNNATATEQLDIYNLTWFASVALPWTVQLYPPPLIITPLTPTDSQIHASQPDKATPPGILGMFSNFGGAFYTIQRVSNSITNGSVAPIAGMPFVTLPPLWSIGVSSNALANPCELSINVWFQPMLDNIAPAP